MKTINKVTEIKFPEPTGIRCLMMPYIQGDPESVPKEFLGEYSDIISSLFFEEGAIGYLTIDESPVQRGVPHRGNRAKYGRALHTEAGKPEGLEQFVWGSNPKPTWGGRFNVVLDEDTEVFLANSIDKSCALWDCTHEDTSADGDIGHVSDSYLYDDAVFMGAGDVYKIGILTPHESLPLKADGYRQFLRIVSSGVHGREPYFTENRLLGGR